MIEPCLTEGDAQEILDNIFSAKINFYKLKNFTSQVRFGKNDPNALVRIPDLKKEKEKLQNLFYEAKSQNKRIAISSEIVVTLLDD